MLWPMGIYVHNQNMERAHIVHQKNGSYVLRYLDQRKIETMSEREFSMNWQREAYEED